MYHAAEKAAGQNKARAVIRWVVAKGHHAHHILPHSGPGISGRGLGGAGREYAAWLRKGGIGGPPQFQVRKAMNELRDRAKAAGFDLHDASNGVSLPEKFHLSKETLSLDYYREVVNRFRMATSKADFESIAESLAYDLLKRSGKLK